MANPNLSVGKRAPAFTLQNAAGERIRLTEQRGRWVVLYFYPKDMGRGCTTIARDFQSALEEFESLRAVVMGACSDTRERHAAFAAAESIHFDLLVDRDSKLASRYGVWREKTRGGHRYLGLVRSTFLIDPSGHIVHLWDNVRVKGHVAQVLARLEEELAEE